MSSWVSPSTTLSGGEAQRVKLATELSQTLDRQDDLYSRRADHRPALSRTSTGLLMVLQKLADAGNTVVVIEHNLDVIKTADYILDLGPEGGDGGGRLVVCGTPEEVAQCKGSYTGQYLGPILARKNGGKRDK